MEILGKVIQVLPIQQGTSQRTGNPWMIQSFIIETQEQYPRKICIEMFGEDKIKANPVAVDKLVTVFFDLESREFNGRWYTSARTWKVQEGSAEIKAPQAAPAPQDAPQAPQAPQANMQTFDQVAAANIDDDSTDLPF